jgi:hypothetical protein
MELPIKARMKFAAMIDGEQIAYDGVLSANRHISTLNKSLGTAPANEVPNIEFEISRWRGKLDEAQRKHSALANLNARLGNFITTANVAFDDAKPAQVKIAKGETITAAAIRVRERIAALALERRKVDRAALTLAELKEQAAAHVAQLRERGKPRVNFGHGQPFNIVFDAYVEGAWTARQDLAAALAYLDPISFLQRLIEDIEALPKPPLALSAKARAEKLAALDAELLILEREDETLVEVSAEEGPIVQRRLDADPRAILGLIPGRRASPAPEPVKQERIRADAPDSGKPKPMTEAELIAQFGGKQNTSAA